MNKIVSSLMMLFIVINISAQTLPEKISKQSCACIGNIGTMDSLDYKFRKCFGKAMAEILARDSVKFTATVENVKRIASESFQVLPSVCPSVRRLVLERRAEMFYAPSSSAEANEHYEKGNSLLEAQDFEGAIKEFKKAIRFDDKFVLALDDLAVCYRRMNQYQIAVKFYNQSLEIFPEGEFALVNIGSAYIQQNELGKAKETYSKIVGLYPANPEGHFGLAKIAFLQEKYADALVPICEAFKIYVSTNSSNVTESEKIIGLIYTKLKEEGKEDFFQKTIMEYNIEFNFK